MSDATRPRWNFWSGLLGWNDIYTFQMTVLKERMAALDALAEEEAKLRCRECSSSSLREYYRGGLSVSLHLPFNLSCNFLFRLLGDQATNHQLCTPRSLKSRILCSLRSLEEVPGMKPMSRLSLGSGANTTNGSWMR